MECHLLLHVLEISTRINDSIQISTSAQGNLLGQLTSDQIIDPASSTYNRTKTDPAGTKFEMGLLSHFATCVKNQVTHFNYRAYAVESSQFLRAMLYSHTV
jgi:hypothetical protein